MEYGVTKKGFVMKRLDAIGTGRPFGGIGV